MALNIDKYLLNTFDINDEESRFQAKMLLLVHVSVSILLFVVMLFGFTDPQMNYSLGGIILLSIASIVLVSLGYLTVSTLISYTGIGILVTSIVFGRMAYNNYEVYMLSSLHMFIVVISSLLTRQRFYTVYTTSIGILSIVLLFFFRGLRLQGVHNPLEIDDYIVAITIMMLTGLIILYTTDRRNQLLMTAEKESRAAATNLKEKEILLHEVHHRVKNNLNVATSLLRMQMNQPAVSHTEVTSLKESISRLNSMALVHEKLYASKNFKAIEFKSYVISVMSNIIQSYHTKDISFEMNIEEGLSIELERAIPCGLIINELISNVYKHAFSDGESGQAWISIKADQFNYVLEVVDMGVGVSAEEWETSTSLGTKIVRLLCEQLRGTIEIDGSAGTKVQLMFPRN